MSGRTRTISLAAGLAALSAAWTVSAQTAIPPSAPDFAAAAAQSDAYEILAADTAQAQTQNPQVRAFAQEIIRDHTRTSESLRRAVIAAGLTPAPPAMGADQASLLAALQSLRGADFDKAYARQQVLAHTQALAVERSYAEAGQDAPLKAAARDAIPIIQHHLEMARRLSEALGGD